MYTYPATLRTILEAMASEDKVRHVDILNTRARACSSA